MKERILTNWTVTRVIYLLMGVAMIVQAVSEKQWLAVGFGGYFAAMGLFAFGCAGGNCYVPTSTRKTESNAQDINFEEVKNQ